MKPEPQPAEKKEFGSRVTTPNLDLRQEQLLALYCQKYQNRSGPALLCAAFREIRRDLGITDDEEFDARRKKQ